MPVHSHMATTNAPGKPPGMTPKAFEEHCSLAEHARSTLSDCRFLRAASVDVRGDGVHVDATCDLSGSAAPVRDLLTDPRFEVAGFDWDRHSSAGAAPVPVVEIELVGEVLR